MILQLFTAVVVALTDPFLFEECRGRFYSLCARGALGVCTSGHLICY